MTSFISNGRMLTLFMAILIVSGLGALSTLPRAEDPRITNRVATVITHLPGASAERVEALISEPIENKLRKLSTIKHITSQSKPGISSVKIELKDAVTDTTPIWSRARDLLDDVIIELPKEASKPELDDDRGYAFTMLIALNWQGEDQPNLAMLSRYAMSLQDRLRAIPGTDFVELFGHPEEEILVQIDPQQTAALKLTPQSISQLISTSDTKVAAGQLYNPKNQLHVELSGELDSLQRIRAIPLNIDENGFLMRLGDVAQVSRTTRSPADEIAIIDDKQAVVIATRMLPEVRVDQWTAQVHNALDQFCTTLPSNVTHHVLFDQNSYTETRLSELLTNILLGFVLIVGVLLLTLGWRSALIVAASLPLTILFTLSVMKYYGLPIHQMSVTGLVVALGIMVDNAIVMVDTIQQRRQQGVAGIKAVTDTLAHLWLPLLGSTLTTVLAFMPIVLMPGPAGEFVGGIALSVIFSLLGSYLISHTLIASLAGRFLPTAPPAHRWWKQGIELPALARAFTASQTAALRYPKTTIMVIFILPLAGFILSKQLPEQFFPPSDRNMFHIEVHLSPQASMMQTQTTTQAISRYIQQYEDITQLQWFIGNSAPSFYYNLMGGKRGTQNYAQAMVTTSDFVAANRLIPELQRALDDAFPQAQIIVRKLEQGPPFNAPIELRLYGPNLDTLKTLGDELRQLLTDTPRVVHTRATLQPGTPKVWLDIDESAARLSGFSLTHIATQLQQHLHGAVGGSVLESTESLPIRVRVADAYRSQPQDLHNIQLPTADKTTTVPLSALGTLELQPSRGAIPRRNGERVNTIEGYIRAGILPSQVLNDFRARLEKSNLHIPAGYRIEIGGESAKRNDAVSNLLASIGVIATLLVTIVVLSFNSFRISLLIFLSAFQSIGLGLFSIWVFHYPFGFTVIVGLLGLMGLAINAAIVILAELKSDPLAVKGDPKAIMHGVQSCTRHITSTTITTVGGFLPLILAGGGFWPPFAVAIAGGTVLTTLLSFYFVPAAFLLFSRHNAFELSGTALPPVSARPH